MEQQPSGGAEAARRDYLLGLPASGWNGDLLRACEWEVASMFAATGLPVDQIRSLIFTQYDSLRSRQRAAEVVMHGDEAGQVRVWPGYYYASPRERIGIAVHEIAHTLSPFYGRYEMWENEGLRNGVMDYVDRVAQQSLWTGIYLNWYHRSLAGKYNHRKLSYQTFLEETWAIACEMGLTERTHLASAQRHQHRAIAHRNGVWHTLRRPQIHYASSRGLLEQTELVSDDSADVPKGIDSILASGLIGNVHNLDDLRRHSSSLIDRAPGLVDVSIEFFAAPLVRRATQWLGSIALHR